MSTHQAPRRTRLYPMPGRGRRGAYPTASWRATLEALWGIAALFLPFHPDRQPETRKDHDS